MNSTSLKKYGKWALVTGASNGIGKSMAFEFAKQGLNLVLVARNTESLITIKNDIENDYSTKVEIFSIDLTSTNANTELFNKTREFDIGIFSAAAGFGTSGEFINNSITDELNMIDLNCRSVVEQCYEFANRFKNRGGGAIVLFSSLFAFQGVPKSANYSATKAFIQNFGEGLGVELKPFNIDVLIAAPGPVVTGFGSRANMKYRFGAKPNEVASSIISSIGKTRTLRPGFIAKVLELALWSTFSRKLRTLILNQIMNDMTQHQNK